MKEIKIKPSGLTTRDHILSVARDLFATDGYQVTSIEKVLQDSGISRGALYHHFKSKEALFEAVLELLERELAESAIAAAASESDPVAALRAGCASFLLKAVQPEVRQIILVDAHAVVGWQKWREIEQRYGLGLLKQGLSAVAATGQLSQSAVEPFAHMILAAMIELAFLNSAAPNAADAAQRASAAIDALVTGLLASSAS